MNVRTEFQGLRSAAPLFHEADLPAIQSEIVQALRAGTLTAGPNVDRFEQAYATYCGTRHAVAASNGTAALELGYRAFGVSGRDVVVPTNTFLSTANAVAFAGGRPVFADLDPETLCVGIDDVERALTPSTAGVVVVHIAGLICPAIDDIASLCRQKDLFLLEDAAHAHGASRHGRRAGAIGDAAAFSFFPTKPMTTGEGGMVTTDDARVAAFARRFRTHGVEKGLHVDLGDNMRLPEVSAILGFHQLQRLDESIRQRQRIASVYDHAFAGHERLSPFALPAGCSHSYYKYPLIAADVSLRTRLSRALGQMGVPTGTVYFPPCHMHPYAQRAYAVSEGGFPKAEDVLPRVLCLPIHAGLDVTTAANIADAVIETWRTLDAG